MYLQHCEMCLLLLLAGDVQIHLRNRYKVNYLSLLNTLHTYCSRIHVNIEHPTVNVSVSCFGKHDIAVDEGIMRSFRGCALSASHLSCQRSADDIDTLSHLK